MARKGLLAIIDQAVCGFTTFATALVIARTAGAAELGLYALGFSMVLVVIELQNSLVLTPYTVYSPRLQGDELALYRGSTLVHFMSISGISVLGFCALAALFSMGVGPVGLGTACWALAFAVPFLLLRQLARMVSFAHFEFNTVLILDSTVGLLQIGGLLMLARLKQSPSIAGVFGVMGAASGFSGIIWLVRHRATLTVRLAEAQSDLRRNWKLSRWLVTTFPVTSLRTHLGHWLLAIAHGPAATGLFTASLNVTSIANPFLTGVTNLVGAKAAHTYAEGGDPHLRAFVTRASLVIGSVMALFCFAMILFGGRLASFLYGKDYAGLGPIVSILAINVLVLSLSSPAHRGLYAREQSRTTFLGESLILSVLLTVGVWLVIRFGVLGAAVAALVGHVVGSIYLIATFAASSKPSRPLD